MREVEDRIVGQNIKRDNRREEGSKDEEKIEREERKR